MKVRHTILAFAIYLVLIASASAQSPAEGKARHPQATAPSLTPAIADEQISKAYIYLLGRLLVARQEQLDFKSGFRWNELLHRAPGAVDWPNPNLDVAYSEAWIAVDDTHCAVISVPKIEGRYFTVQLLDGWGETLANINERLYPSKSSGEFAFCHVDADVRLPEGVRRIDIPVKQARMLTRVALGTDREGAIALQHRFTLSSTGPVRPPDIPKTLIFDDTTFPGVEAFDSANAALDSEADRNPGFREMQALVRRIASAAQMPEERTRIDRVIRTQAFRELASAGDIIGHGSIRNSWARPSVVGEYSTDYLTRTLVNRGGIWANVKPEVLYYRAAKDANGIELSGENVYTLTFPKAALPSRFATWFWSVIAVDAARYRVLPNDKKKYLLNEAAGLTYGADGSLTLYFAAEKPADAPEGNWLPTPRGTRYRLTFRYYGPIDGVANGTYYPPPLVRVR
ncbi:DUF1214 domain-containing protein [Pandoraea oxalativorans]|uniref:DUF1254 domain-containing protein n=1 Tax=Pandoraea oxalativorans TaxID=573737 RepID=A0A0E3YI12_9BURK|nr:DUF1214 domain-containing protein [Pandoraea oxalativorans]AKC72746.2 hypothetical protein MB84_24685 [Pandoraea oxalativorans]